MPDNIIEINPSQNIPWQDANFNFNGKWIPDANSILIGPENFQTLQNLRYKNSGLESVAGYTKVNTTPLTTYVNIKTGHQLKSNKTQTSYILVQSASAGGQGRVYQNRTAPGSQGDFDTTNLLDINGNTYFQDASTGLTGRFSDAPQSNIAYCNGEESMIFGGDEQQVAACFSISTTFDSEAITGNNGDFEGANQWANVDFSTFDSTDDLSVVADAPSQTCTLPQVNAPTSIGFTYQLTMDYTKVGSDSFSFAFYDINSTQYLGRLPGDTATGTYSIEFDAETTGGLTLTNITGVGYGSANFDNFSLKKKTISTKLDVTEKVNNTLHASSDTDMFTINAAGSDTIMVMTTRPIQALKFYVDSGNVNETSSETTIKTWVGDGYSANLVNSDGTSSGGISFAQTGTITLTSHTNATSKLMHFEELYLYAYEVTLSAGDADVYHITVDPAMQPIKDIWDGVYRQPIQWQVLDGTSYFDYTLQVNESSDINAPIGGQLDGLTSSDKIYILFEDKMSAIKFIMLGDKVNSNAVTIQMKYWTGTAYAAVQITDGTQTSGTTTFSQSGLVYWTPPTDEQPRTLFGSFGYVYEFSLSGTLSGTKGGSGDSAEIIVDVCNGIPAQNTIKSFSWSTIFGSRLVLGDYKSGNERNRLDYCVSNAPDVWNGVDSSDNGKQSLFFGGNEPTVAGTQIYNRFGANVYSMLLVLKYSETYILVGDTPDEFVIYPVAKTLGCIAPLTLDTAEIGMDLGNGLTRNVAIWLSHSGPVMFDGAILVPLHGIDSFFDPNHSNYIKFSLVNASVGWVDPNFKEYNLVIPSGSTATGKNKWLVYDLARRKWFEKVPHTSHYPQCGFKVISPSTGEQYIYGGKSDGYMVELENGTTWEDGIPTGIVQTWKTGDFYPSNNPWDETIIRKFYIITKELSEVSDVTNTATVTHYKNTDTSSTSVGTIDLSDVSGTERVVRTVNDLNKIGWSHAFGGTVTTSNVTNGLQPLYWGIQYRTTRKKNTAT